MHNTATTLSSPAPLQFPNEAADAQLAKVQPMLRRVAARFGPAVRGSLSVEDLVQVGGIEALKLMGKYDASGSVPFGLALYRRAMRACLDQIRLHAADVHLPDHVARGRRVVKVGPACRTVSSEEAGEGARVELDGGPLTPEALLGEAQQEQRLRAAVQALPHEQREIVQQVFGLGRPATSARDLARQMRIPRARIGTILDDARAALRRAMVD